MPDETADDGGTPTPFSAVDVSMLLKALAPSEIEALSNAVIGPRRQALLLNADNTPDAWVRIDVAVASGRAFLVEVDDDVLAVDADGVERGVAAEQFARDIRAAGLSPVVSASGRPGHRHVICRVDDSALRQALADRARSAGLDVRRAIRPPGAPHRLGLGVALLEPRSPEAAVAALAPRGRSEPRTLSKAMRLLLQRSDVEGRYASRSEAVQALALGFVNAGLDCSDFMRALLNPRHAVGDKVRELAAQRGNDAAHRYVARTWAKACAFARRRPAVADREDVIVTLARIEVAIESAPWPGRRGAVDWSVARAHLRVARRLNDLAPDVSDREVAELAGISRQAVARAHSRLQRAGWLRRLRRHHDANAARWRLRLPPTRRDTSGPHDLTPPEGGRCAPELSHPTGAPALFAGARGSGGGTPCGGDPAHDVWRYSGGMGKVRCRVWGFLHQPRTTREVAAWLGRGKRTAQRHLSALRAVGLAAQDSLGAWHRGPADPRVVAERLGVAGEGQRQRWRHEDDRETHSKGLEVWHRERGRIYVRGAATGDDVTARRGTMPVMVPDAGGAGR